MNTYDAQAHETAVLFLEALAQKPGRITPQDARLFDAVSEECERQEAALAAQLDALLGAAPEVQP